MTLLSSVEPVDETPIDLYLSSRSAPTAIEQFARRHEGDLLPRQARYYRDLIPVTAPGPGQQYGFAVDLDACTGCKACVTACHSLNGLDDGESWRKVTVLGDTRQVVTAGCHHCIDPACLKGCPVDAYEKDPVTGIVVHLDDQCIGCSYCTLTCPYEVPVYNRARGIVRKCDMCHGRLAEGEAPACVQACPNGAIAIELVDVAAVVEAVTGDTALVPGAPPSSITTPTTTYRSARGRADGRPAPPTVRHSATPHTPLAVMLVLTQLSVGAFVVDLALSGAAARPFDAAVAAAAGALALGASVLHLGRPLHFYRAVIGLRHSWLSREVLAFGAFTGLAVVDAAALALHRSVPLLGLVVAAAGVAGVGCSVLVYASTHRASWRAPLVAASFSLTTAVCGLSTVVWASSAAGTAVPHRTVALVVLALLAVAKLFVSSTTWRERLLASCGGVVTPVLLLASVSWPMAIAGAGLIAVVAGDLLERSAFFTAADAPR